MEITLKAGDDVISQLADPAFLGAWENLYQKCPWATGSQNSRFVRLWYDIYRARYTPVILTCLDSDGQLSGLLALAHASTGKKLVGAGGPQAEYQVWIALPDNSNEFMQCALAKLQSEFPQYSLHLKYLPSGVPLEVLRSQRSFRQYCTLTSSPRPYVLIDAAYAKKTLNNKGNRRRLNGLKRLGEVRFEKITAPGMVEPILDEYVRQYDFRQAAMYDCPPFRIDPYKRQFVSKQLESGLLHATVMRVGDEIVSINFGTQDKNGIQLGITHSPRFASLSPGTVHADMLCLELATENMQVLDLTPGEGFKNRIATNVDEVHELKSGNYLQILRQKILGKSTKALGKYIQKLGMSPATARLAIGKFRKNYVRSLQGWWHLFRRTRYCIYQRQVNKWEFTQAVPLVEKNSLNDLMSYDDATSIRTYQEFQYTAMKRLESNQHVYTNTRDGCLMYCAWIYFSDDMTQDFHKKYALQIPEKTIVVHDFYINPKAHNDPDYRIFLGAILGDLARQFDTVQIAMIIPAGDTLMQKNAEQAGFSPSAGRAMPASDAVLANGQVD